ncbi:hypothetical protein BSKO_09144 [Bryopsis sp. KO-2023]|nr:hypothetical protein BSKO_09144 [Bryopsis sp. KO-2023]
MTCRSFALERVRVGVSSWHWLVQSHAKAQADIKSAVKALSTVKICDPVAVRAASTAVAKALAQVYVEALAKVSCDGKGFGCGFGVSQGDAFATAYAEAFSKAVAAAFNGNLSALCIADLKAIAVGVARAAAFAVSQACVSGSGSASVFQSTFVSSTSVAIAKSISTATAVVCNKPKDNSKCGADVVGSSTTKDNVVKVPSVVTPPPTGTGTGSGSTGGSGSAGQVQPCLTIESLDCCFDQSKCGPKGLWAEAPLNPAGNKLVFKRGVSKALCYCY